MHLLLATGLYPPEIGGPATYAKLLEERLPKEGIEVTVLPFSTVRIYAPIVRHIVYAWKLAQLSKKADAIFVQDTVSTGVPAALVATILRKKLIVRVPGDYAWEQGTQRFSVHESIDEFQKHFHGFRVALFRLGQRFTVNRATRIIAPSEYLARVVRGWLNRETQIDVIYNGVALSGYTPPHMRSLNTIVSSGRLVPWKGVRELIEIVARTPAWELVILGDGPERSNLETFIREKNAGERITLVGQVSQDTLREWFAKATVFALNSRYEGLSHTLVEAMSTGAPVVATNIGGNPEVIEDNVSGLLFDVGNTAALERSLALLMQDADMRENFGRAAHEKAKSFSVEIMISKTASLLKKI